MTDERAKLDALERLVSGMELTGAELKFWLGQEHDAVVAMRTAYVKAAAERDRLRAWLGVPPKASR